jgi:hypothetical protein
MVAQRYRFLFPNAMVHAYPKARDISHIDLLNIDVQGGERMVLEGARRLLKNGAVSLIYTEAMFFPFYELL